jgi:hypothetical protein
MDYYQSEAPYQVRPEIDNAARFVSAAEAAVTRNFGSAKNVERAEDAGRAETDLVAVLEMKVGFQRNIKLEKSARVIIRVEFRDLSGKRIAELSAQSVQSPIVDAKVKVRRDLYREFSAALDEAAASLEEKVRSCAELSVFAASRARERASGGGAAQERALSSEVDQALYRDPVEPTAVAWVVGVERYDDGVSAPHAERDAAAVRSQLIGLGWPDRNVFFLAGRRASRSAMREALEAFQRRGAAATKAFVYFAGRTTQNPKTGRSALMGWDGGAVDLGDILEAAAGLRAGWTLAVVEAPAALGAARPGVAAMAAAGPAQKRQVDDSQGHGLFTLEVLQALIGAADKNGKVSARGVFDRAAARVGAEAAGQMPAWSAPEGFDPVLVEGSRQKR